MDREIPKETIEIIEETMYEVYDPWTARVIGIVYSKADAKLLRKAIEKRKRRTGDKYA